MGEIILNLDLPEYQDDFLSETTDSNQLWQQQANRKLVALLQKMGNDAHRYKEQCQHGKKIPHQKLSSYHHAVFISGARGAGKTVFLKNAKAIWQHETDKQDKKPSLHFMPVVDPTLLNINERFSEVIIASVYAAVEEKLTNQAISKTPKDNFYQSLKDLSGALVKPSELAELRGIDRVQKYRSGIHLEQYFHQFLIASVELLGCDALVLPIDDVDMKISNAFEVLDDIRCLLSCPLVLPLVSGDDKLYRHLVTLQFEGELVKNKEASNAEEGRREATRLSDAYLTKVFPHPVRLPLQPIDQLLPQLVIQDKENAEVMTYGKYAAAIKEVFYPLCNGLERSTDWPQPANAREVTQLVRLLPPSDLKLPGDKQEMLWRTFSHWAEAKQDGAALTNAESYLYLHTAQKPEDFSLARLIAFNPLLQKERYYWAKKNFYSQQVERINELKTTSGRGEDFNRKILDTVFAEDMPTLRSMPPLEYIKHGFRLTEKIAENKEGNRALIAVYTHHDYYSQQLNRGYHIFFSRAFEILVWSMLAVTEKLPSGAEFDEVYQGIFQRAPFYSIFSMNETKAIDEDDGNESDGEQDLSVDYVFESNNLLNDIHGWIENNKFDLKNDSLIPLLSAVFNKTFSQLNLLVRNFSKNKKGAFNDEHLSDLAKRFEYIFINALVSFLRDGKTVINTNVAIGARSSSVRDFNDFMQKDKTLSRNISGILTVSQAGKNIVPEIKDEPFAKLITTMWDHPIFNLSGELCFSINGSVGENELSIDDLSVSGNVYDLKNYYLVDSGMKRIITNEVYKWAVSNKEKAKIIYSRLDWLKDNDRSTTAKIEGKGYIGRLYNGIGCMLNEEPED
ncbi:antiviral RADAR system adenosine triphosphatase RdrA [Dickeya fangzhongdai]|uniref:antiviral RADAR system adenosine triphosphatase RdrA n=1 Tax=Dickeya fangzhongdai TaxID=1778540 RepID=UPI0023E380FA|nr:antiviral RADAR system adenosine triphosphatase RdrA [Dickeya fangzhongdai]WES88363.1 hypothetical protein PQ617_19425 [Dickeya fangzhongdai]